MAKRQYAVNVIWNIETYWRCVADSLYSLGRVVVDECRKRYDGTRHNEWGRPGWVTKQLRNSIGMAVYLNGQFYDELCYVPGSGGKAKKWKGRALFGNAEAVRVLKSQKPKAKVAMVLVAAMPYRQYLEGKFTPTDKKKDPYKGKSEKRIAMTRRPSGFKYGTSVGSLYGFTRSGHSQWVGKSKKGHKYIYTSGFLKVGRDQLRGSLTNADLSTQDLGGYVVISDMIQYLKDNALNFRKIPVWHELEKGGWQINMEGLGQAKRPGGNLRVTYGKLR